MTVAAYRSCLLHKRLTGAWLFIPLTWSMLRRRDGSVLTLMERRHGILQLAHNINRILSQLKGKLPRSDRSFRSFPRIRSLGVLGAGCWGSIALQSRCEPHPACASFFFIPRLQVNYCNYRTFALLFLTHPTRKLSTPSKRGAFIQHRRH